MIVIARDIYQEKIWELQQDNKKIGFLHITPRGYTLKTDTKKERFRDLQELQARYSISFYKEPPVTSAHPRSVYDYESDVPPFNEIWDASHGTPLYTKTKKSKSYYCAGWYGIVNGDVVDHSFCPKKITLQRNRYYGPFKTNNDLKSFLAVLDVATDK